MTDRTRMMTVLLEKDYRVDDAEEIANAIRMLRGVRKVEMRANVTEDYCNRVAIRAELEEKLLRVIRDEEH